MDANGDGILTRDEILDAYKRYMDDEQAEIEVQKIMEVVDMDGVLYPNLCSLAQSIIRNLS
jgi:Ca2+-binding EF-hand superfamily protein